MKPQPDQKKTISLEQLEHALEQALQADASALPRQIRNLLTISQRRAAPPSEMYRAPAHHAPAARYSALVSLAHALPEPALEALYEELRALPDLETRLTLQAELLRHFSASVQQARAHEIWGQLENIRNAVTSITILLQLAALPALEPGAELEKMTALGGVIDVAQKIPNLEARVRSLAALANHAPQTVAAKLYRTIFALLPRLPNESLKSTTIVTLARYAPERVENLMIENARLIVRSSHRARALVALIPLFPERPELMHEALAAMARIESEDDRTEVLCNFAASLQRQDMDGIEYPETLRDALDVAIGLNKRLLRARALVALAPLLTTDLQGEALAAVNALPNERERATLLAELAPSLPPNVLVASLAVAHTMREQDARVHALTVLAHHVPQHARHQTILDAFAAASNLSNQYERVTALLGLVDVLPDQLRGQAFVNALDATRMIENPHARARALSMLGQHLPERLRSRALDAALELGHIEQRLSTLTSLAPHLKSGEHARALRHMLDSAQQIQLEYKRARAISLIAPHLTGSLIDEALELAHALTDPLDRFNAYLALSHNLSPQQRPQIIALAWDLLDKIEQGYDRAGALMAIAPYLNAEQSALLKEMALDVVQNIEDDYDKASAITLLATLFTDNPYGEAFAPMPEKATLLSQAIKAALSLPYQNVRVQLLRRCVPLWLQMHDSTRYALWKDAARRLKALPLPDVLLCLEVLMPVLEAVSGTDNLPKIAETLGFNVNWPET